MCQHLSCSPSRSFKITQAGLTGGLTQSDRLGQCPQKAIWNSPLDRTRRVDQDSYIEHPNRSPNEGDMASGRCARRARG
jgi:hypothetical protein